MSRQFAILITALVILFLFRREQKGKIEGVSRTIWLPFAWMFLAGSRYVSQWINKGVVFDSADSYLEGSPLDRAVFLALVVLGLVVLAQRKLDWREFFRRNVWICLFLLYEVVSSLWSEYPFISLKRWVKASGTPIMALIILTEEQPTEAITTVFRRVAFVLLPISVLFIRYFPDLGRAYHMGMQMSTGAANGKNGLGALVLISGICFLWEILFLRRGKPRSWKRSRLVIYLIMIPTMGWLLYKANSATSLVSLVAAIGLLSIARLPAVALVPSRLPRVGLLALGAVGVLQTTVGLSTRIVASVGRDPDLTSRVPMWHGLLAMARSPLIGVGYESFWFGSRLPFLSKTYEVAQAHNGYLETYLNLGLVGLFLLAGAIVFGLVRAQSELKIDYKFAVLKITLIVVCIVYNWTEAAFYGVNNLWLLFFLGVLATPVPRMALVGDESGIAGRTMQRRGSPRATS